MATGDGLTDFNGLFKQTYADMMHEMLYGDGRDYTQLSKDTLRYRVNRYEDEKARKELRKRELPLWKVLNDPK